MAEKKILCELNIQKSLYRLSLPSSQFQVSARAMKAAVAGISSHGWTEVELQGDLKRAFFYSATKLKIHALHMVSL